MFHARIALVLLGCCLTGMALAQPAVARLDRALVLLGETASSTSTFTLSDVDAVSARVAELQQVLKSKPDGIPAPYLESFDYYAEQLNASRASPLDPASARRVKLIDQDVGVKLAYANAVMALAPSALMVQVSIKTTDQQTGAEQSGFVIEANPYGWGSRRPARHAFGQTSPITGASLTPGFYLVFAMVGDQVVGQREVTLGLNGQRSELVVVPVKR